MEQSAEGPPQLRRLWPRRRKVHSCESRAAPREAEEHREPCAVPGEQASAAAESRAGAPHSPCCAPRPSPCQQEELGLWTGPAAMTLLQELGSQEWNCSDDCQSGSDGEETLSKSAANDPKKLEHYRGPGQLLKLFLQDTDQSVSLGEDCKAQEWWQKNKDVSIHTIWANPLYPALTGEPRWLEAEEADSDLPCTSPVLVAPMDTQPAAAALAAALEDEEQHVSVTAQAQEVAKTAASAASGAQVAGSGSWAVAPHSPCWPPSPLSSQQEDLGRWAGPAGMALLAELWDKEGSCCTELRSGPSTERAEGTDLSRSTEEESASGSLPSEEWPEDTEPNRMTREETSLVSIPREAWAEDQDLRSSEEVSTSWSCSRVAWEEDQDLSYSNEEESASGSLPRAESWDSEVCTHTENGVDQPQEALICPYHMKPTLFHMGTGTKSEEQSLSQMEDAGQDFRGLEAAMGTTWWEEALLKWNRCKFKHLQGLHSAAAVPVQQPSPFRRALRALCRAFRSLRCLIPVLHS